MYQYFEIIEDRKVFFGLRKSSCFIERILFELDFLRGIFSGGKQEKGLLDRINILNQEKEIGNFRGCLGLLYFLFLLKRNVFIVILRKTIICGVQFYVFYDFYWQYLFFSFVIYKCLQIL